MNDKVKSNSVITTAPGADGNSIRFIVRDAGEVVLNLAGLSTEVRARALLHGLIQRVSDKAALSRNPETGKPASPADKLAAMRGLVEHYNSGGEWSTRAAPGGPDSGLTLQAIANVKFGGDTAKASAAIDAMAAAKGVKRPALLATLRASRAVGDEIARIRAASPAAVDADDLLGEMGA